jgi:putative ABC transport system permease protein
MAIGLIALALWGVRLAGLAVSGGVAWANVLLALGFAIIAGLIFGVYPAWKASRITPIAAIRSE